MAKTETLEDSFKKLDEIVAGLENTELSMDAALKLYKGYQTSRKLQFKN